MINIKKRIDVYKINTRITNICERFAEILEGEQKIITTKTIPNRKLKSCQNLMNAALINLNEGIKSRKNYNDSNLDWMEITKREFKILIYKAFDRMADIMN